MEDIQHINKPHDKKIPLEVQLLPTAFLSGKDKAEQFQKEFRDLLAKYDAELTIENFGRDWNSDEKIVVNFAWDEDLSNRTNDGIVPDWVIGRWENGR